MSFISDADWADFYSIINASAEDFFQKTITWRSWIIDRNGDAEGEKVELPQISLKCLINYNYMRTWPITNRTESGGNDRQSVQVYFNKNELALAGYLTPDGNLNYNPGTDKFIIDGIQYEPSGDTSAAQAKDIDLFFTLILQRDYKNNPYPNG